MTIFERVVPLSQQVQWLMLKSAMESNTSAETLSRRLGWSIGKVRQCIWTRRPGKMRLDTFSEFVFACGGQMPQFRLDMEAHE